MRKAGFSLALRSHAICRKIGSRRIQTAAPSSPFQVTTLPNKIRVATESAPGHFSSVGLYIDAGSRYETPETSGVSHFLDRMAFKVLGRLPFELVSLLTELTVYVHTNRRGDVL